VETLSEASDRLTAAGYREDFRAEEHGLRAARSGCFHEPEAFAIDEIVRFEGVSDPDDESILFALRCKQHDVRGTFAVAFGPVMRADDAEAVRRLRPH
jgi:hypothetical protein